MILAYILGYLVLILLAGYSLLRYYHLWKRLYMSGSGKNDENAFRIYCSFQILLMVIFLIASYGAAWIPNGILLRIMQGISCVYSAVMIYSPVFCFIRGIIRFAGRHKKKKGKLYRFFNHPAKSIYMILGITVLTGIFSFYNINNLQYREYQLSISKTAQTDSMSLVVMSDLHLGSSVLQNDLEKLIQKINVLSPDLILLCGDIIDGNTSASWRDYGIKQLASMESKYGVFFVEGNREVKNIGEIAECFKSAGIPVLQDQTVHLINDVQIVGLRDPQNPDKREEDTLMAGLDMAKPVIALTHRPKQLQKLSGLGVDLTLSGHTLGEAYPVELIPSVIDNDMVYGMKKIGAMSAITTAGAGRYGIPSRLMSSGEILLVKLAFHPDYETN